MTHTTEDLEQMLADATPGPWWVSFDGGDTVMRSPNGGSLMGDAGYYPWVPPSEDWPLIAAAPTITAELIAARRKLEVAERLATAMSAALPHLEENAKFLRDIQDTAGKVTRAFYAANKARAALTAWEAAQ